MICSSRNRIGIHLGVCLFLFSSLANSLENADVVGEGQIRYLKNRPDPGAYTYESKVTISKASLESGLVEIQTCHKQLDPIRKVVILFNKDRIKDIQVRSLDGIAMAQPALPLVEKLLYRAEKNDLELSLPNAPHLEGSATEDSVGKALLEVIAWANRNGIDAERALRSQAHQIIARINKAEGKAE